MSLSLPSGLRILIADNHASTRIGIKQILRKDCKRAQFGEAATAREAILQLTHERWDLLILDLGLPDRDGSEVLQEVAARWPRIPVLIHSALPEAQLAKQALRTQVAGCLGKESTPSELIAAVKTILAARPVSRSRAARLRPRSEGPPLPHECLSSREFQVLRLTVSGRSGKSIAGELGVSQKTVSTYRARLMKKLQVASGADLIRYAVRQGLVEPFP
jgi:two-component system invasion response regulator UvrY